MAGQIVLTLAMPTEQMPLYTLGHSNRSIEEFVGVLQSHAIQTQVCLLYTSDAADE